EILNEEIGARKLYETPHFTLSHYAWDDDVIERIAATAERAHAHVLAKTGLASSTKATISVNPTYGAHSGLRGYGTLALFMPGTGQILVRSLESYGAGLVAPGETQEDRLFVATTHEYAHLVNNEVISTARIPKWMVEGFAEYVAEHLRAGTMAAALRSNRTLTLAQTSEIIEWGEDPGRGFTGADIDRAYSHAAHATQYFMERFGQDLFFAVARDFADSRQWEPSLHRHTNHTTADLESAYLTWSRHRYGL
ncbi:MAG TPA: hypothetical protein VFN74_06585, partial [Chloroflexota bacterium]|nr:hypothetical protein [Chloroflexota bacterium]